MVLRVVVRPLAKWRHLGAGHVLVVLRVVVHSLAEWRHLGAGHVLVVLPAPELPLLLLVAHKAYSPCLTSYWFAPEWRHLGAGHVLVVLPAPQLPLLHRVLGGLHGYRLPLLGGNLKLFVFIYEST